MVRRFWRVLLTLQLLLIWVSSVTSRNFAPTDSGTMLEQLQPLSKESMAGSMEKVAGKRSTEPAGGLAAAIKIGSSPPSCENKCFGCTPCEPAQVPATSSGRSRLRVQYTNYVPEGWKCKCGPSFYSP